MAANRKLDPRLLRLSARWAASVVAALAVLLVGPVVMARTDRPLSDEEQRDFLDRHYPFIEQGAEPPGRPVHDERFGSVWKGKLGWRTRHGPSVVRWQTGKPWDVTDALYPDGSRGEVNYTLDHGFRRRSSGPKRWIYGTIDIRSDDVVFADAAEQPAYRPPSPGDDANLERDLANDARFLDALKDDQFALIVYNVLYRHEFVRIRDLKTWSCGDRGAARLVAHLRGFGESYQDFFLNYENDDVWPDDRAKQDALLQQFVDSTERALTTPVVPDLKLGQTVNGELLKTPDQVERFKQQFRDSQEKSRPQVELRLAKERQALAEFRAKTDSDVMLALRAELRRLGWRTVNDDDERRMAREAMSKGLDLLEEIKSFERRPAAEPASWAAPLKERLANGDRGFRIIAMRSLDELTPDQRAVRLGLEGRLDQLAISGRISEIDYNRLRAASRAVGSRIGYFSQP